MTQEDDERFTPAYNEGLLAGKAKEAYDAGFRAAAAPRRRRYIRNLVIWGVIALLSWDVAVYHTTWSGKHKYSAWAIF